MLVSLYHTKSEKDMPELKELEIRLYQLLKEDNWSDANAEEAVHTVKALQKEANKELLTKADFMEKIGDVQVKIIMWVVGLGITLSAITISAMVFISRYI